MITISFKALDIPDSGAIAVFAGKDGALTDSAKDVDSKTGGAISRAAKISRFKGSKGQTLEVLAPNGMTVDRIVVIGLGTAAKLKESDWLEVGAKVTATLQSTGSKAVTVLLDADEGGASEAAGIAEGMKLRSWRFDKYRTKEPKSKKPTLSEAVVGTDSAADAAALFKDRDEVIEGVFLTRELVSEPANILNPETFADRIAELSSVGLEIEVLGEAEMEKLGMGSLLGVGQGSVIESKLAIMRWNGAGDDSQPIAFVGKGVTFDTGGISLKPGAGMDQMKWDMGGAGTVVGLMRALAGRKAKVNVVGIVGLVENMPDGNAQRPGDVVTSMSGQTIEILNTDAEGRLVLADALWYCQDRFKPKFMIDLATLTGAMIVSLGFEHVGFFTDSDEIADSISDASAVTGDKSWRLPLHACFDKMINTPTADVKNLGGKGAGSITAAQFLKRFTNDVPWAHMDIAGVVWSESNMPLSEKGGTGHSVRLLDRMVADKYES